MTKANGDQHVTSGGSHEFSPLQHTLTDSAVDIVRIQTLPRYFSPELILPERDTGNLTTLGAEVKIKYVLALPPTTPSPPRGTTFLNHKSRNLQRSDSTKSRTHAVQIMRNMYILCP
jgi:hypothetical protein